MRPFEAEYSPFWNNKFGRRLHSFSGGPRKQPPMVYMVPTTPSKPAFLMKPNAYRAPASSPVVPYLCANDYGKYLPGPANCNNLSSASQISPAYANTKFERFPQIMNNFSPSIEPNTKHWYMPDESYIDENARNARRLLNEIDIKTKMKKYDANELFNTEILDHLDTKQNESYQSPQPAVMCDSAMRPLERRYPTYPTGLHRSNSSLPSRYAGGHFQQHNKRLNNLYEANYLPPTNNFANLHNNNPTDNGFFLEDIRSYL